jgi:hypothetical protein
MASPPPLWRQIIADAPEIDRSSKEHALLSLVRLEYWDLVEEFISSVPNPVRFCAIETIANDLFLKGDIEHAEYLYQKSRYYEFSATLSENATPHMMSPQGVSLHQKYFLGYCAAHHHLEFLIHLSHFKPVQWANCILSSAARTGDKSIFEYYIQHPQLSVPPDWNVDPYVDDQTQTIRDWDPELGDWDPKSHQVQYSLSQAVSSALIHKHYDILWFLLDNGASLYTIKISQMTDQILIWILSKKYLGPLFKELYKKIKSILIFEKDKKPRVKNIANLEQYRLILRTLANIPVDLLSSEARQYLRYILHRYAAYFSVDLTTVHNLLL